MARRSALLQRDGDVVDLDGISGVKFPGLPLDSYYLVVRHRNHLGIMSANPLSPSQMSTLVDFTLPNINIYDKGILTSSAGNVIDYTGLTQKSNAKNGYAALWSGDLDGNSKIKLIPGDMNEIQAQVLLYITNTAYGSNCDNVYGYRNGDMDMNGKVKFDNPASDTNLLLSKLLFYPLNVDYNTNFDVFIEQLPKTQILGN